MISIFAIASSFGVPTPRCAAPGNLQLERGAIRPYRAHCGFRQSHVAVVHLGRPSAKVICTAELPCRPFALENDLYPLQGHYPHMPPPESNQSDSSL